MTRSARFYAALASITAVCIFVGHAVAQDVRAAPRMSASTELQAIQLTREGLEFRVRTEPARAHSVLKLQPAISAAAFPSCKTVPAHAMAQSQGMQTISSPPYYGNTGCGALVIDYAIPAGARPHEDYGAVGLGSAGVMAYGGISAPTNQAECNGYEEEARYWWRHLPQGSPWQFSYAAKIEGRWVSGGCRLFAMDAESRFAHVPWNPSNVPYILRGAFEARVNGAPKPMQVRSAPPVHAHPPLPYP